MIDVDRAEAKSLQARLILNAYHRHARCHSQALSQQQQEQAQWWRVDIGNSAVL